MDLRGRLREARPDADARLAAAQAGLRLADLATATGLGPGRDALAGRNVLVWTKQQIGAAQALVELDGLAARLVLCPPDLAPEHFGEVMRTPAVEAVVTDTPDHPFGGFGLPVTILAPPTSPLADAAAPAVATRWILFTSGTTGAPKLVVHTLAGLTGAIGPPAPGPRPTWATFYDIRRYGGLQMLLRALTGGCALVLSEAGEDTADHLARLAQLGATHVSGTPSHWRRLLMTSPAPGFAPRYVRLSGEIADQPVLDALRARFPQARIAHAFASTECGVVFEVGDGLEGFPERFVGAAGEVEMRVRDGSLRVRSPRTALGYLGPGAPALADEEGFVDTGDMVALQAGRWRFDGRRNGVINVGGLKVHPEEVEAVVNRHPAVRGSLVRARRNPITGAVVTADVALLEPQAAASTEDQAALRASILAMCRAALPAHKAPASIRFVPDLGVTPGGKVDRSHG